jgi:hypothetical protein
MDMETAREHIEALGFKWFSAICLCCSLCFGWLLGWSLGFNEITYSSKKKTHRSDTYGGHGDGERTHRSDT